MSTLTDWLLSFYFRKQTLTYSQHENTAQCLEKFSKRINVIYVELYFISDKAAGGLAGTWQTFGLENSIFIKETVHKNSTAECLKMVCVE